MNASRPRLHAITHIYAGRPILFFGGGGCALLINRALQPKINRTAVISIEQWAASLNIRLQSLMPIPKATDWLYVNHNTTRTFQISALNSSNQQCPALVVARVSLWGGSVRDVRWE